MLTLTEVKEEAKKRGVELSVESSYRFRLQKDKPFDTKAYSKWKEKRLAYWKKHDEGQIAYYKKYNYNYAYHPIIGSAASKEPALKTAYLNELKYSDSHRGLELSQGTSIYSCAIGEFGGFTIGGKLQNNWDLLLTYFIHTTQYHYLKCDTPVKPAYSPLRKALKALGFEMRAKELSNHGKYYVEVWELIKPYEKKKAKKKEK